MTVCIPVLLKADAAHTPTFWFLANPLAAANKIPIIRELLLCHDMWLMLNSRQCVYPPPERLVKSGVGLDRRV